MRIERKCSMCLQLSADEMAALKRLADERGMPKVSLIRQWIRDAARPSPMPSPEELRRQFEAVFGDKIRRM